MAEYGPLTEKEYYTLSERNSFTKAENDIYDGKLRICDIPFEYRSLPMYRAAYRSLIENVRYKELVLIQMIYPYPQQGNRIGAAGVVVKQVLYPQQDGSLWSKS